MNNGWVYQDRVSMKNNGECIIGFLTRQYKHSSSYQWGERISQGKISINNEPISNNRFIYSGDIIKWNREPWEEPSVPKEWEVIFDNGDILAINKPSGLPVMPGGGFLENTLCTLLKNKSIENNEKSYPKPIHRLGRFTSGVLLCARKKESRAILSGLIRTNPKQSNSIKRIYRGLAQTNQNLELNDYVSIDIPIVKQIHQRLGYVWNWEAEPIDFNNQQKTNISLPAKSLIRLLERRKNADLLEIIIFTGRPHQIRIHLASIGAPLIGDPLYKMNGKISNIATPGEGGYQLHCYKIENLIINNKEFSFQANPPQALQIAI